MTQSPAQNAQPSGPGGGPRRRKPPRRAAVTSVARIAPRLVSVLVTGDELDGFTDAAPTSHLKLFLPPAGADRLLLPEQGPDGGQVWNHDESLRPVIRTYTPRRYDPATRTLEIQVVLHGEGPASEWAQRVKVGDEVAVGGPGGRFVLDEGATRWWIAGDESALPAVGTLLDVLPPAVTADVHLEVQDADDVIKLPSAATVTVTWHHRLDSGDYGAALEAAARSADLADGTRIWVACESGKMRDIRRYLTRQRGIPASQLVTRGYWRQGESNHPDHDYGED
ncbi:MAG TPA: siderophore-interacting protein [Trebonia sp.]|nr:siderophore-interacting protein [Trebonia sp.]